MAKVGRPQMYTPLQIEEIAKDLLDYIERSPDPTIVGFTSSYTKYSVNKDYISDHKEFSELRKKAIEKQEAYLLYGVTLNKLNATMGIFRLKQPQHGYTDKQQLDTNISGELKTGEVDPKLAAEFTEWLKNKDGQKLYYVNRPVGHQEANNPKFEEPMVTPPEDSA